MNTVKELNDIIDLINSKNMLLIYFSGKNCGVCKAVKPKVIELLKKFPNIVGVEVDVENSNDISAQFNIFTNPSLLIFIEGRETIRELRYLSILELEKKISRFYDMYYSQ